MENNHHRVASLCLTVSNRSSINTPFLGYALWIRVWNPTEQNYSQLQPLNASHQGSFLKLLQIFMFPGILNALGTLKTKQTQQFHLHLTRNLISGCVVASKYTRFYRYSSLASETDLIGIILS